MSDKFTVEIISPDQTILKQETSEVVIPSFEGQMGILNNHIPLITFLRPGIITCLLYTSPSPRDRTRSRMPSSA